MGAIDYARFDRLVTRCAEIAVEPGMKPSVVRVHDEILKSAGEAFRSAHREVTAAETSFSKEGSEARSALADLDAPYREARSVVLAYAPETKLPDTLKSQKTDTDQLNAIEALLDVLDEHAGQGWADEQAQSGFGKKAAGTVKELNEAIVANKALSEAREVRARSYGPAYERYLRFKRVVRDALGSTSKQYKRIHLRGAAVGTAAEAEEVGAEAPLGAGGTVTPT
ncbi:MAG: hypothetical protein ACMG6S_32750 [Byssovorax sp.]